MNTKFFYLFLFFLLTSITNIDAQCNQIGLIGEFTSWTSDHAMTRDANNPDLFTTIVTVFDTDVEADQDGIAQIKFRVLGDWGNNWGSPDFPTGTGAADGDNIEATPGTYMVTFNCSTGDYSFVATCPTIGLIGEFTSWTSDHAMTRDANDPNLFTTIVTVTDTDIEADQDSIAQIKFRVLGDWGNNWGAKDFPTGTGTADGDNIEATPGTYMVTFNCSTGDYSFVATCPTVGIIGEFTSWTSDHEMTRDASNPNLFTTIATVVDTDIEADQDGVAQIKFRVLGDWGTNWGSTDFPTGTGIADGDNIEAVPGTYAVSFNCSTGEYTFVATCGEVSMIGAFVNWNGDVDMTRRADNPDMWDLTRSWYETTEGKFRQNHDWAVNWGDSAFPAGTATDNGPNIAIEKGIYDVAFNCSTGAYSFTENATACGEIGMIGDFNAWGVADEGPATDVNLVRSATSPNDYSLIYNFEGATKLLFRMDADETFTDVWGGAFPSGTGVKDGGVSQLEVPGGLYEITFNCISGDFNFIRLGSSIAAPKVFAISIDGKLSEKDWKITEPVSKAEGELEDLNEVFFGVTYNEEFLYIGVSVKDAVISTDTVMIGIDGDKSGGEYDAHDMSLGINPDGTISIAHGPADYTPDYKVTTTADGYEVEVAILWSKLDVTPASGSQIGVDILNIDYDADKSMYLNWNGNTNFDPSSFGAVNLGDLACGDISLYNSSIGDIDLHSLTEDANTYVGTYMIESDQNVVFRKDHSSTVTWGDNDFPMGTAAISGDEIPMAAGRYRVSFGCLDGGYSFTADESKVAFSDFTADAVTIDGDLSEYSLEYGMDAGVVVGNVTANNEVKWSTKYDNNNLYIGVQVIDAVVEGSGNPWDNDAIEVYIDGNHDQDGPYDADFDTQLIMDFKGGDVVWAKADGAPIDTPTEGKFLITDDGYNIEFSFPWSNIKFVPGANRSIGFTIGNNDSDGGVGREYQTAWAGDGNNWNDTGVHGDLQLRGGSLTDNDDLTDYNSHLSLFPNPLHTGNAFHVLSDGDVFTGDVQVLIFNMTGQRLANQMVHFDGKSVTKIYNSNLTAGTYFVQFINNAGNRAVKKLVIQK